MDDSKNEYTFMQEKVVRKRKNKIKKICIALGVTLVLAVIFGIVARIVFIVSDSYIKKLVGVDGSDDSQNDGYFNETDKFTEVQTSAITYQEETTKVQETTVVTTAAETTASTQKETDTGINSGERAGVSEYLSMFSSIRSVATDDGKSLIAVTAVEDGQDWLGDPYQQENETTGIYICDRQAGILLLVNLDKIQDATKISVELGNASAEASLWSYDYDLNFAMLYVDTSDVPEEIMKNYKAAKLGETLGMVIGTPVLALGNPCGYMKGMELGTIISKGSIAYVTDNSVDLFLTDTLASDDGDGVIVNLSGEIIGIITRTLKPDDENTLCTAVSISSIKTVISELMEKQDIVYLGVHGENIPSQTLEEQKIENGIYVSSVDAASPAYDAGIKAGDIITSVGGSDVTAYSKLNSILKGYKSGDSVEITVRRVIRTTPKMLTLNAVLSCKNSK